MVSSWKIKNGCNKNSGQESTLTFILHGHKTKSKLQFQNKLPKFSILKFFKILNTRHTFGSWLIRCVNMKWIRLVLWKTPSGHDSVHRRTDGQGETSIPPPPPPPPPLQLRWREGYSYHWMHVILGIYLHIHIPLCKVLPLYANNWWHDMIHNSIT